MQFEVVRKSSKDQIQNITERICSWIYLIKSIAKHSGDESIVCTTGDVQRNKGPTQLIVLDPADVRNVKITKQQQLIVRADHVQQSIKFIAKAHITIVRRIRWDVTTASKISSPIEL